MSPIKDVIGFINQNSGVVKDGVSKVAENKKALACIATLGILFALTFKLRSYIFTASDRSSSKPPSSNNNLPAGQIKKVAIEGYISNSESKWIGMDKMHRFSQRLETHEGKLVIGKGDFYVTISIVDTAMGNDSSYSLPSTLFTKAKEGDVISYTIDGKIVKFSLAQQKYSQTDFQTVLRSNLFALTRLGVTRSLSYGSFADVPKEEKYLLAFGSGIDVDFIEFDRENARVYYFEEKSFIYADFKDHFQPMQAKFSFNDGFAYTLGENKEPVSSAEAAINEVDFYDSTLNDEVVNDEGFALAIIVTGCRLEDIAVICSGTKLIVLGIHLSLMNESAQKRKYFHGFEKRIETNALTLRMTNGLLVLHGKFEAAEKA